MSKLWWLCSRDLYGFGGQEWLSPDMWTEMQLTPNQIISDLCAMRAVNIFTRAVLSDEILHLKVFYTFYSLMGTEGGAKTLDSIFCFHVKMGGAIPTSYDGLRRLAIRMLLFAHSQDSSDSSDSGVVEEED